jgi:hypothetical protein
VPPQLSVDAGLASSWEYGQHLYFSMAFIWPGSKVVRPVPASRAPLYPCPWAELPFNTICIASRTPCHPLVSWQLAIASPSPNVLSEGNVTYKVMDDYRVVESPLTRPSDCDNSRLNL